VADHILLAEHFGQKPETYEALLEDCVERASSLKPFTLLCEGQVNSAMYWSMSTCGLTSSMSWKRFGKRLSSSPPLPGRSQAGWQNKRRSNREHLLAYLFSVWGSWGVPHRGREQGRKLGRGRQDQCQVGQRLSALLPQGLKQAGTHRMSSGAPPGLVIAPVLRTRTAGRRARSARLLVASTPSTRKNRRRCCRCLRSRRAKRALSRSVNRRFSAIRASSNCARSRSHSAKSCWQFRTGGLGGCIFVFVRLARKW
jgi:hypothetical protein